MRLVLTRHPDTQCTAVTRIEVGVVRPRPRALELRFHLTGKADGLIIPPRASPDRTDELWKTTCFEVFVRAPDDAGYCEFNLSPSTQWAAYRFTSYRNGLSNLNGIKPPRIETNSDETGFELRAWLDLPAAAPWRLGLSVVIEDAGGGVSYWALAHPPGKADFHHADCFAAQLMAPHGS